MTESNIIRILIADDHKLFRSGLIKLLEGQKNLSVAGEAGDGEELIEKYFRIKPDVSLVDISMPVIPGTEAAKRITEKDKSAKILFLSMYDSDEYVYSCMKSGGYGLINKNIMKDELIEAILEVSEGRKYFGRYLSEDMLSDIIYKYEFVKQHDISSKTSALSKRESEVLVLIGEGYTSTEMADKLSLSVRTIDSHRLNMIKKLGLKSMAELIKFAVEYSMRNNS